MWFREQWKDLAETMRDLTWNEWEIKLQHAKRQHSLTLQATRGEWMLELSRSQGLTDDILLARPAEDAFIRLDSKGDELYRYMILFGDIQAFWDGNPDRRRYGPEGLKQPAEDDPKMGDFRIRRWARETGQLDKLDKLDAPEEPRMSGGPGGWAVDWYDYYARRHGGLKDREAAMEWAWQTWSDGNGQIIAIIRPDGQIEMDEAQARISLMAYDAKRNKS